MDPYPLEEDLESGMVELEGIRLEFDMFFNSCLNLIDEIRSLSFSPCLILPESVSLISQMNGHIVYRK
jgi:hypothetical protein